jgi:hypothetical protein
MKQKFEDIPMTDDDKNVEIVLLTIKDLLSDNKYRTRDCDIWFIDEGMLPDVAWDIYHTIKKLLKEL